MKPIEQLRSILCTGCKSVEKDVKELRFGCSFIDDEGDENIIGDGKLDIINNTYSIGNWENGTTYKIIKNLGNPLSLKHLMMYCNESKIFIEFNSSGDYGTIIDGYEGFLGKYDITKELHEQEEETLVDIINFLKG